MEKKFFDRDLSWLSFSERILQEASDKTVPLLQRLNFLVIYYLNLGDFMRVRVAALMNLCDISDTEKEKLGRNPDKLLRKIRKKIDRQQEEFNRIFNEEILPGLGANHIHLLTPDDLNESQKNFVRDYFDNKVKSQTESIILNALTTRLRLRSDQLYMIAGLKDGKNEQFGLVKIPSEISRLVNLPDENEEHYLMILDDIVRLNLSSLFPNYAIADAFSFLYNVNANIYLRDEYHGAEMEVLEKVLKADGNINSPGIVYDCEMPKSIVKFLRKKFKLRKNRCLAGGRYQRFSDFKNFPSFDQHDLLYKLLTPVDAKSFPPGKSMFDCIAEKDVLTYYPYENYDSVLRLLDEAANSVSVESIKMSLYRVAKQSRIITGLIKAAGNGKAVFVYEEVKASSDQEANIFWSDLLERSGIKVINGYKDLKVHTKLLLIERKENEELKKYAYLSTGNFNETTAKDYSDFGLFTASDEITKDVALIFETIEKKSAETALSHLLLAPMTLRKGVLHLIDEEIKQAEAGNEAHIFLKLNGLDDAEVIEKLYEASEKNVKVQILVRSICSLIPDFGKNIEAISIIDRFLEHSRVFIFYNSGDPKCFCSSADLMTRNLNHRMEAAFPVLDPDLKNDMLNYMNLLWNDPVKARLIDSKQKNHYRNPPDAEKTSGQQSTYQLFV